MVPDRRLHRRAPGVFVRKVRRLLSVGRGLLKYVNRGFGIGHLATVTAWLTYSANGIVTAMVSVSFGGYASALLTDGDAAWAKAFAVAVVVAMTALNVAGSSFVARVQSLIVFVVVGILAVFAAVTIANMDASRLAPSGYPGVRDVVSIVALTFFAFLGFGVVTFAAKDLAQPSRQLPRAMLLAVGIATAIYEAVALGVLGTLSVEEAIASGPTAIAVAAQPVLGDAGYWLMSITALFANGRRHERGPLPAQGLCEHLASTGQFPTVMGRRFADRAPAGLIVAAVAILVLVVGFDLSAIASIGSAVALTIFCLVTAAHLRVRADTGARTSVLVLALATTGITLLTFVFTTLVQEPASMVTLLVILAISVGLDHAWTRMRTSSSGTRSTPQGAPPRPA